MNRCRGCRSVDLSRVLDLGDQPAADYFPPVDTTPCAQESSHPLAMDLCAACGLAQLADDDTVAEEPRGVEPQALRDQAAEAVRQVAESGLLRGTTAREFGSPHGGTWLPLLSARGFTVTSEPADVVLDSMGLMHDPDQRAAVELRAAALAVDGVLLVQFHSLTAIIRHEQWNALRHGHFAYYSLNSLVALLDSVGLAAIGAWEFELYGGSVLVAARRRRAAPPADTPSVDTPSVDTSAALDAAAGTLERILADERALGVTDPKVLARLGESSRRQARELARWARGETAAGRAVYAYGAASRAVALFALAGLSRATVRGVADASPNKQGRRMPATDIPIISPDDLVRSRPDAVLLTVPDLYHEVRRTYPGLAASMVTEIGGDSHA